MGTMFETTVNNVNHETGEIISSERTVITKKKKDEYVRFFLKSVASIVHANLTATEHNILYVLQRFTINNSNLLMYNSQAREIIAEQIGVTAETVRKGVSKLVQTQIINRNKSMYFLNPIHFGRGDWKEIKKLRKNVETVFDFENLTIKQVDTATALYENSEQIVEELEKAEDVKYTEEQQGINNIKTIEYTDKEANNTEVIETQIIADEPKAINIQEEVEVPTVNENKELEKLKKIELELLKEENKAKELNIKELTLRIEAHKLGL